MLQLDERELQEQLKPLFEAPELRRALDNIANDPLLLSLFLWAISYLEGIGELAIGAIRQAEIAGLMHDLRRHELEEHGHMTGIRLVAEERFPQFFCEGRYVHEDYIFDRVARGYYLTIRETARRRLRRLDRYSPLALYLTITFGGETLVELLYAAVIDAMERSTLPAEQREHILFVLRMILSQEETHDVLLTEQHAALLAVDAAGLSPEAVATVRHLGRVTAEDYKWVAEFMVREFASLVSDRFADASVVRAELANRAARTVPARV